MPAGRAGALASAPMGTDKRQRQKEGRAIRIAAAEASQKKAEQRALVLRAILVVVVVGVVVAGLFILANRDDDTASSSSTTVDPLAGATTLPTDPTATLPSAAGMPCVAPTSPPAEGEPVVPVVEGDPPTELVIEDLTVGTGDEITDPTQTVTVNYVGVACSTGVTFDSSYARGEPVEFPLDGVIPGWTQGLIGMKVGGQRLLGIPSELAYGAAGGGPDIAPDEALWFVVELEGIGASTPETTPGPDTETTVPASVAPDTEGTGGSTTTAAP